MLIKGFSKLFSQSSRFMFDSVRKKKPIQSQIVNKNVLLETLETDQSGKPTREWEIIRQELLKENNITENNIDAIILGHCVNRNNYSLGSSYINFLDKEKIKFTLAASGKYFKLLYLLNKEDRFFDGKPIKKDQEQFILKKISEVREQHKVLDSITLECCIEVLSLTKEWKKCIDLLNEIKVTTNPNSHAYSTTISAAFLNKEENLGWSLLEEMSYNLHIENIVYFAYINYLKKQKKNKNNISELEKMFKFMQENDIILGSNEVPLKIAEYGNEVNLPSKLTTVNNKGSCRSCKLHLEKFILNDKEFEELKSTLFKNVIIGKDIFAKTDPREVDRFKDFIKEQESFDVVLDGLNVAYSAGTKHSPEVFSALVASVVAYFVEQNKKVLVVGRYHMNKWPKNNWTYITRNATVFLTRNISQDDPYLLYCALNSGKDTIIVTRDLMRGHKFLLNTSKLRILFSRWLTHSQYQLLKVSGTGNPVFRFPPAYTLTSQKNKDTWHIPFKDNNDPSNINWLCIKC